MGNRANYLIREKGEISIFYTHWRSVNIAQDLLLGPKKFLLFIQQFQQQENLLQEPWMEGCVSIDVDKRELLFWEMELLYHTSVRREYLKILREVWKNWTISFAEKEMHDIEQQMGFSYTAHQKTDFERIELRQLKENAKEEYVSCIAIIRKDGRHQLRNLYSISDEKLVLLGTPIIKILEAKPNSTFPTENELETWSNVGIDCDTRSLYINQWTTGLEEELATLWPNWKIEVGNFGYLHFLEKMGKDSTELRLSEEEVQQEINHLMTRQDNFDPNEMAKKLIQEGRDIQFNPHFFENIKPQKGFWDRLKEVFRKK